MRRMLLPSILIVLAGNVDAQRPEIANIFPDFCFHADVPRLITGENFDDQTVVWELRLPTDEGTVMQAAEDVRQEPSEPPETPPKGSRRLKPIDAEKQVLTVVVPRHYESSILWVMNSKGFSKPYVINAAKPFWLSESKARQGQLLHLYGFGLRVPYKKTFILFKNELRTEFVEPIAMPRARRVRDPRLLYFRVPSTLEPDEYMVFVHNPNKRGTVLTDEHPCPIEGLCFPPSVRHLLLCSQRAGWAEVPRESRKGFWVHQTIRRRKRQAAQCGLLPGAAASGP